MEEKRIFGAIVDTGSSEAVRHAEMYYYELSIKSGKQPMNSGAIRRKLGNTTHWGDEKMVKMKNIRVVDNQILMDCYKEGKEEGYFSLVVDSRTYDSVSCSLERPGIYARQAAWKIAELCKGNEELPTEAKSVWC